MEQDLFIAPALTFEKVAAEATLPEDPNMWPQEVLQELYKQVPYIADFDPHVVMDRVDGERGYAFGHVEVLNKSEIQRGTDAASRAAAGIRQARIPIIVKNRKLQPFDVLVTEDSKMLPLTESRLRQAVFRPQAFDVTSQTPGDLSMIGQLYPPFRQNYGFGGSGAVTSTGMGKTGATKAAFVGIGADLPFGHESRDPEAFWEHAINIGIPHGIAYVRRHKNSGLGVGLGPTGPQVSIGVGQVRSPKSEKREKREKTKKASLLAAVLPTITQADYTAFFDKFADAHLQASYMANAEGTEAPLSVLVQYQPPTSTEELKYAASTLADLPADVVQIQHRPGEGYAVKRANHSFWAPLEDVWGRGAVVREFGEKVALAVDMHTTVLFAKDAAVASDLPEEDTPELVKEFGVYKVQDETGKHIIGYVFPNLLDIDGEALPICLFTNGTVAAVQGEIAGINIGGGASLFEGHPRGYGAFYQVLPNGRAQCTIPLMVHASIEHAGEVNQPDLIGETYDGRPVVVRVQPNLRRVVAGPEGHMLIPSQMRWLPLDKAKAVTLTSDPTTFAKTASSLALPLPAELRTVTIRAGGPDTFSFEGVPVAKLANEQRAFLNYDDAAFLLAGLGVDPPYAAEKLAQACSGSQPIEVLTGRGLAQAHQVLERFESSYQDFDKLARALSVDLVKEAAIIPDPVAVDTVLALGFINGENLQSFISYLPKIDEAQSKLCELLVASRLGLRELPTAALEKAVRAVEEVIEGLNVLAFGTN